MVLKSKAEQQKLYYNCYMNWLKANSMNDNSTNRVLFDELVKKERKRVSQIKKGAIHG